MFPVRPLCSPIDIAKVVIYHVSYCLFISKSYNLFRRRYKRGGKRQGKGCSVKAAVNALTDLTIYYCTMENI